MAENTIEIDNLTLTLGRLVKTRNEIADILNNESITEELVNYSPGIKFVEGIERGLALAIDIIKGNAGELTEITVRCAKEMIMHEIDAMHIILDEAEKLTGVKY